jgi:hypothetical protein
MEYIDFPYYLFDFNQDGVSHTGEQEISDEVELEAVFDHIIKYAMEQRRKCIIRDMWNNCLFLTENGQIVFPTRKQVKMMLDSDIKVMEW